MNDLGNGSLEGYEPPDYDIPGLVPFAMNGRGDHWSWYTEWTADGETAVVFSPHDEDTATYYAPNFARCIYGLRLEEMAGSLLVEYDRCSEEELSPRFHRYAEEVSPFLPPAWVETLRELSRREFQPSGDGDYRVLTHEEAKEIIRRDLDFDGLDRVFPQYR